MHHKNFQAGADRVYIGYVQCIAMTKAGAIKRPTVIIDGGGTVNNFIATIAIHIGNGKLMVALAGIILIAGGGTVKEPALGQLAVALRLISEAPPLIAMPSRVSRKPASSCPIWTKCTSVCPPGVTATFRLLPVRATSRTWNRLKTMSKA